MKLCLITAIVGFAGAQDVVLDTNKLTDFTAEFDAHAWKIPNSGQEIISHTNIHGKVQLNLLDQKVKFSYEGSGKFFVNPKMPHGPPPAPIAMLFPGIDQSMGEIVIDGIRGLATITQKGTVHTQAGFEMDMNYCFHVKFPVDGNVPPPTMLKRDVDDQVFPRIEQRLNEIPHNQTDNGDLVYTEKSYMVSPDGPIEGLSFTIKPDGSPVSWHMKRICDDICMERHFPSEFGNPEVGVNVDSFTAGAGDVTPLSCIDSSVADLSEHPGIMHAAVVFDTFMEQMSKNSGFNLPSLQPLIEEQMLLAENVHDQGAQQQPWTVALFAGVAGVAGGAVVLALDKAFRRQGRDPPLLSEA